MFRKADLVLLSKTDLLDVLDDFSPDKAESQSARWLIRRRCCAFLRGDPIRSHLGLAWLEAQFASVPDGNDAAPRSMRHQHVHHPPAA